MSATRPVIPMSDSAGDMSALNMAPTQLPDLFLDSDVARRALSFRLPLYEELRWAVTRAAFSGIGPLANSFHDQQLCKRAIDSGAC